MSFIAILNSKQTYGTQSVPSNVCNRGKENGDHGFGVLVTTRAQTKIINYDSNKIICGA